MATLLRARFSAISGSSIFKYCVSFTSFLMLLVLMSSFTKPVISNKPFANNTLDKLGLTSSTPAAGAYSLRLLSSTYTNPLVRIAIGSNFYDVYPDATTNHGFSLTSPVSAPYSTYNAASTGATGTALSAIMGSNSATVAIWYDQSGNSLDGIQGNSSLQPQIINSGTINTTNNKPAIKFTGAQWLVVTTTAFNADLSGSIVYNATGANTNGGGGNAWYNMNGIVGSEQGGDVADFAYGVYNGKFTAGFGGGDNSVGTTSTVNDGVTRINSWTRTSSSGSVSLFNNGNTNGAATLGAGNRSSVPSVAIGAATTGGLTYFNGTICEIALFPVVYNTTERQAIEASQATYYSVSVLQTQIGTSGALTALTTTHGIASASTSFDVSGSNMSAGILVTPPAGYEVSTNNSSFSSTVTVGTGGTITSTPVYVRLAAATNYGTYAGDITLSSTGANSVTIATVAGTVTPVAADFPTLSYGTAKIVPANVAITPIAPSVTQVNSFGYGGFTSFGNEVVQGKRILKDSQGNLYVLDQGQFKIYKYPANGGATVEVSPGAGNYPYSLTIDAADNLYFSDANDLAVKKIAAGTGTVTVLASGFNTAYNIAAASDGTIYVVEIYDNVIKKIPAGGGTIVTVGTGFNTPLDVAVDSYGDVYVADQGNGKLKKVYMSTDGHTEDLGDVGQPFSVTVDKANNVYVGDVQNFRIFEFPASGSGRQLIFSGLDYQVTDGLYAENGVVYIVSSNHRGIYVTKPTGGYFMGSVLPAGLSFDQATGIISGTPTAISAAKDYMVTAYNGAGGTSSAVNISVQSGNANLSALTISGATISPAFDGNTITYTASAASTVATVDITPTVADAAATITYNSNPVTSGVATTIPLNGGANVIALVVTASTGATKTYTITINKTVPPSVDYGTAQTFIVNAAITPVTPTATNVAAFGYGGAVSFGGGLYQVKSFIKDSQGNTYLLDPGILKLYKYPAGGGPRVEVATRTSGTGYPGMVALDGADNLYVYDVDNSELRKIETGTGNITLLTTELSNPYGLTVAKDGTIYVADIATSEIKRIPATGGTPVPVGTGFNAPTGVAIDAAGDLYVADQGNGKLKKIFLSTDGRTEDVLDVRQPVAVTVDKANNVFVSDISNFKLIELPANGSGPIEIAAGNDFQGIYSIQADEKGAVYLGQINQTAGRILNPTGGYFINTKLPDGLSFDQTTGIISGTPTVTSPATEYQITAYNGVDKVTSTVNIAVKTDLDLTNLLTDAGALTPTFNADSTSYKVTVDNGTTSANITATLSEATNSLTINGTAATSGVVASIALNTGDNVIPVVVTSPVDNSTTTYTVNIHRVSNDYKLHNLTVSSGSLTPSFNADVSNYTVDLPYGTSSAKLTPTAYALATIKVADVPVLTGAESQPLSLNTGDNNIEVRVTAEDGTSATIYTVNLRVAGPSSVSLSDLTLSAGTLNPAFSAGNTNYQVSVPVGTSTITVHPVVEDALSVATVNGSALDGTSGSVNVPLNDGLNVIAVSILANDGTTTGSYTITVNKLIPAPAKTPLTAQVYNTGSAITPLGTGFSNVAAPGYFALADTLTKAIPTPTGIAINKAGDLFVADVTAGAVYKIPAAGGAPVAILTGLNTPLGVATDAAGNVYAAALGNNNIKKITPSGTITSLGGGLSFPTGLTVDAAGNIYVDETANHAVKKITPAGITTTITTDLSFPYGITVDANYVYVADNSAGTIERFNLIGGAKTTLISGLTNPTDVKLDAIGNIYVNQGGTNTLTKYDKTGNNPIAISTGYEGLFGIAVGTDGKLYTTDNGKQSIEKLSPSGGYYLSDALPDGLVFDTATGIISGTPTAASAAKDYTITAYNSGGGTASVVNISVLVNTNLTNLAVSSGTLDPEFDSATTSYAVSVPNTIASLTLTPTVSDANATVTVKGVAVTSGEASAAIPLTQGANTIPVMVTGRDNVTTKQYTVAITRRPPIVKVTLAFDPSSVLAVTTGTADFNYSTGVSPAISTIRVKPTTNDPDATIKVNDVAVTSGEYSEPITLNAGPTIINVSVIKGGETVTTYSITVNHDGSTNPKVGLTLDPASVLVNSTGSAMYNYTTSVSPSVSSVRLKASAQQADAVIRINGNITTSGTYSAPITLNDDATVINVAVTAQDGVSVNTYAITVYRNGSNNADVSLVFNPALALVSTTGSASVNYTTSVSPGVTSISVKPTAQQANAVITVNGSVVASGTFSNPIALSMGATVINISVAAQDGSTTKTYAITVNRTGSNNAKISIALDPTAILTNAIGNADVNYAASVPTDLTSVRVRPTALQEDAVIKVNGNIVSSGALSDPIMLGVGATVINLSVTAQDGTTILTYAITVNRSGSNNAKIGLTLDPTSVLAATTGTSNYNYVASVSPGVGTIRVKPSAQQADAVIRINGTLVTSGTFSDPITLAVGSTVINVAVTAQDGVTVKTYAITVNRAGSNNARATFVFNPALALISTTGPANVNYTSSVAPTVNTISVKPTAEQPGAVIRVNGDVVSNGSFSNPITLNGSSTVINVAVTAEDGVTVNTYAITVNRNGSNNAKISLALNPASILASSAGAADINYSTSVSPLVSSISIKPTAQQADAVIRVNGSVVSSGSFSNPVMLTGSSTVINLSVTAQDGVTVLTYSITVNRTGSNNAKASFVFNPALTLTTTTGSSNYNYLSSVAAGVSSISVKPTALQADAAIKVNGATVASGSFSNPITLNTGTNVINAVVTAQDGVTVNTYSFNITRAGTPDFLGVDKEGSKLLFANKAANNVATTDNDGVVVHQGVSPNGDGSNDFLYIEGISAYPGNKLSIMNTGGALVFEARDYGKDGNNVFDGHSNKTGTLLKPGTYFYALAYQVGKEAKRKTGYIIIKY